MTGTEARGRRPVRLVVVGDLMVDLTVAGRGHGAAVALRPGGSALNTALWAAALGAEATVVGRVGADLAGRALRAVLEGAGVRAEIEVDRSLPTGTVALVDGETRVDRGANAARWRPRRRHTADVALLSGYLPRETLEAARPLLDAPLVALGLGRLERPCLDVDVVIGNAVEAGRVTGERDPAGAARLLATGDRIACVTLGAEGALAARNGEVSRATPSAHGEESVRGAGDAFAAGFLVALARGLPLPAALIAGCEAGTRSTRSGGHPSPR